MNWERRPLKPKTKDAEPTSARRPRSRRLIYRPFVAGDAKALLVEITAGPVLEWIPVMPHSFDLQAASAFISDGWDADAQGRAYSFAVTGLDGPVLLGSVEINVSDRSISYWMGAAHWGKGFATEAVAALLCFARDDLGFDYACADVMRENAASVRVLDKTGFKFDHLRSVFSIGGPQARTVARYRAVLTS